MPPIHLRATTLAPGLSWAHWASRGRAAAWASGNSFQFEFGPLSEASIGNVGQRPNTTGRVDHVVTPELIRTLLIRSRTPSNTAQGRTPWYRAARPLR